MKEEDLELKCHCHDNEECNCGEECHCNDYSLPTIEERLVLVGLSNDEETNNAKEYLKELKVDYKFLDLKEPDKLFEAIDFSDVKVPSLLLIQTVVSGVAPGLEGIKEAFKED